MKFLKNIWDTQKLFRRMVLLWSITLTTFFVVFLMDVELLVNIGTAGATVATAVVGILTTITSFYQWHRQQDDHVVSPDTSPTEKDITDGSDT